MAVDGQDKRQRMVQSQMVILGPDSFESCPSRRDSSPISPPFDPTGSLARKEEIGRGFESL